MPRDRPSPKGDGRTRLQRAGGGRVRRTHWPRLAVAPEVGGSWSAETSGSGAAKKK